MKFFINTLTLLFFLTSNSYSNDNYLNEFNKFLLTKGIGKEINICKEEKRKSKKWFDAGCETRPGGVSTATNNLKIKFYQDRSSIPRKAKPKRDTLLYYTFFQLIDDLGFDNVGSPGSDKPYQFQFNLREDENVKKEMNKSGLLSYLLFENNKIVVDEITPKERFGLVFDDKTMWTSNSVGKSLVSYVTGHAICGGYIESINSRMNDWPLIKNTLYDNQRLIDVLNMAAGDIAYSRDTGKIADLFKNKGRNINPNNNSLKFHMEGYFKDSKMGKNTYNYSNIVPNIIINYVWYKSNGDFQKILDTVFRTKIKSENNISFLKMNSRTVTGKYPVKLEDGPIRYSFRATRYDFLRMAKAMMDDWNNDTCVGKYLKTVYENRIPKVSKVKEGLSSYTMTNSYGGFFHTDYKGIDRPILGMDGYGGQSILIDMEKSRIVVINTVHSDYNWKKIVHSVIKNDG
jgi:hypothetical protein|tara:strand:+ start:217 stop:1590 length:1374 start_codon:yes stop_codon:yes gene_type:complete